MRKKRERPNDPRVHLKIGNKHGSMLVLCGRQSDSVSKVTEKVEDVSCRHCERKLVMQNEFKEMDG